MVRNEMINSFAQLDTLKNSVISGIPFTLMNKKISDIKKEYFQNDIYSEKSNTEKQNNFDKTEIINNSVKKISMENKTNNEINVLEVNESLYKDTQIVPLSNKCDSESGEFILIIILNLFKFD